MNHIVCTTTDGKKIDCVTDEQFTHVRIGEYELPLDEFCKIAGFYLHGGLWGWPDGKVPGAVHRAFKSRDWVHKTRYGGTPI